MADVWYAIPPRPPSYRWYAVGAAAIVCMTIVLRAPRHTVVFNPHWQPGASCVPEEPSRGVARYLSRAMQQQCAQADVIVANQFEVDGVPAPYCWALLCTSGRWLRNATRQLRSSTRVQCKVDTGLIRSYPCPVHLNIAGVSETIADRTLCCIVNHALHLLGGSG